MLKKLLLLSFTICVIGCQKQEGPIPENAYDLRAEIIKGKTDEEIKTLFFTLSIEDQKNIYLSKFSQILKTEISSQQRTLLNQLKDEVKKVDKFEELYNPKIQEIAIKIANITSEKDFIEMFTNFRNFYPSTSTSNNICETCISSLELEWKYSEEIYYSEGRLLASCNCKWTCGISFNSMDVTTTSDCSKTSYGCGFLFLQSCEKRDSIK
jgi:hypothetical protein